MTRVWFIIVVIKYTREHIDVLCVGDVLEMFDRYIKINEKRITAGQNSSGSWYCKELIAETTKELKELISEVNQILNEYNQNGKEKKKE